MHYVPVTVASWDRSKVTGQRGKVTKKELRDALRDDPNRIEFRSESTFHRAGSYLTVAEAVEQYTDVTLQVMEGGSTVAMIVPNHNGTQVVVS